MRRFLRLFLAVDFVACLIVLVVGLVAGPETMGRHRVPIRVTTGAGFMPLPTGTPTATLVYGKPTPEVTTSPIVSARSLVAATACSRLGTRCAEALLALLNHDRIARGRGPLVLDARQSSGIPGCAGSTGHSLAMARSHHTWHKNHRYPWASFPADICGSPRLRTETVLSARGPVWESVQRMHRAILLSGPHGRPYKHLMSRKYHRLGIGLSRQGNRSFLTLDFLG